MGMFAHYNCRLVMALLVNDWPAEIPIVGAILGTSLIHSNHLNYVDPFSTYYCKVIHGDDARNLRGRPISKTVKVYYIFRVAPRTFPVTEAHPAFTSVTPVRLP